MSSAEKIKNLFAKSNITVSSEVDDKIVRDALTAFDKSEKTRPVSTEPNIWGIVMRSRITTVVAAAVIIIAVMIGVNQFGGSIDGTSVAWADVREAFLAQTWVHLKYDNGAEIWYDLQNGRRYYKNSIYDGGCLYIDNILNIRQWYVPEHGKHISEDRPVIYKDNLIPPWEPKTAWEAIIGHWEQEAESGGRGYSEVERITEKVDGKQLIRFDRYYNDAVGRRLLVKQIWADPKTRLPVKVWERLQLAFRKQQNREFITGDFDFPKSGPSSIYDLGVPRDLPVVKEYGKVTDSSIAKVVEAGNAALARFPSQYRAITWPTGDSSIEVVYRDGEKIHHNHYFNLVDEPEYSIKQPISAEEVLRWTQSQVPVNVAIFDGSRSYIRSSPHPSPSFTDHPEPRVRVTRSELLSSSSRPHEQQWPYANRDPGRFERIQNVPEELSKYVGLRIDSGDIRRDFYIDPEHDYICARWIWWKLRSDTWQKHREYQYSDFTCLPDGQWYAAKRDLIIYADRKRGTVQREVNWNVDYRVLEKSEYPVDIFDGEKLLEDAKVETY